MAEPARFLTKRTEDLINSGLVRVGARNRRPGSQTDESQNDGTAPETLVVLAPEGGIPAGTYDGDVITPGFAECAVQRLLPYDSNEPEVKEVDKHPVRVFNLSSGAVDGGTAVVVVREKFGAWVVASGGGGGGSTLLRITGPGVSLTPGTGTGTALDPGDSPVYPANVVTGYDPDTDEYSYRLDDLGDPELVYFRRADDDPPPRIDGTGFYFGRTYGDVSGVPLYHGESQGRDNFPARVVSSARIGDVVVYQIAEVEKDPLTKADRLKEDGRAGTAYRFDSTEEIPPVIPAGQAVECRINDTEPGTFVITAWGGYNRIVREELVATEGGLVSNPDNCTQHVVTTLDYYQTKRLSGRELCGVFSPAGEPSTGGT